MPKFLARQPPYTIDNNTIIPDDTNFVSRHPTDTGTVAFRIGQIDALARVLLASPALYTAEMRRALALNALSRSWDQYRKDRAITTGARLIGPECFAQRHAFLALLEHALPSPEHPLAHAIRTVRTIAIKPIATEAADANAITAASAPLLDSVLVALRTLPGGPLERLMMLIECFRFSSGDGDDPLSATARTPCWAINLAATARGDAFGLSEMPLPFPGLVQRRLFRADRDPDRQRADARESLLEAIHATASDIARMLRAADVFAHEFPHQRSNSRLYMASMLVFGLGALTPAQLARALPATKAGAGKLLRQLEARQLVHTGGPYEPFICSMDLPIALPDWRHA